MYNPGVDYSYSIWKEEKTNQVKYSWVLGDWSQCSVTCGGGVKQRYPVCQESILSYITSELERPRSVEEYLCNVTTKPDKIMKTCNDDPCHYHWWTGPWQACPVTCSSKVIVFILIFLLIFQIISRMGILYCTTKPY